LAPLLGVPVIDHVLNAVSNVFDEDEIVVLTSGEASDDPLAVYLLYSGWQVFRGSLDNVFQRFRDCLDVYPCDWMLRICADSPFFDQDIVGKAIRIVRSNRCDVITNVFPRTFPKGQSFEFLNSNTFRSIEVSNLNDAEKEHITDVFYNNSKEFKILNLEADPPFDPELSYCIDTIEDLKRLGSLKTKPSLSHRLNINGVVTGQEI